MERFPLFSFDVWIFAKLSQFWRQALDIITHTTDDPIVVDFWDALRNILPEVEKPMDAPQSKRHTVLLCSFDYEPIKAHCLGPSIIECFYKMMFHMYHVHRTQLSLAPGIL